MSIKYARINLSKIKYQPIDNYKYLYQFDIAELNTIYQKYCNYKKFESVMPIFDIQYTDKHTDVIGYYDNDKLVAFSLIRIYNKDHAESLQFAWDYNNPKLRLGIMSLKNECAVYKERGFKYLYLGSADKYKSQIDGYELIGKL
jgi:hypothetical protein